MQTFASMMATHLLRPRVLALMAHRGCQQATYECDRSHLDHEVLTLLPEVPPLAYSTAGTTPACRRGCRAAGTLKCVKAAAAAARAGPAAPPEPWAACQGYSGRRHLTSNAPRMEGGGVSACTSTCAIHMWDEMTRSPLLSVVAQESGAPEAEQA